MKLKYAALINIAGIIFSSLSPALADTRSEKLMERQKRLTEQAVMLSDKGINLDDKESQLKRKQAELDDLAKKLKEEKIEISVRDIENEETRAKLKRDSALIAAKNKELQNDKAEFESYRASVSMQAEEAERIMNEANEKLQLALSREDENMKRERELSEREVKIVDELSQINIEKAELLMLREKTDEAAQKLSELEKRENDLKTAQKIFDDEKKKLESERAELAAGREETEKKLAEAKIIMSEAEVKMQKAEAILTANQELEAKVEQLRKELIAKSNELDKFYQVEPGPGIAELQTDTPANVSVTVLDKGIINWSDGSIRAKGMGIVPPDKTEAQGKALARRAAIADLQRNLLETVQGVQIDAKTQVKDFIASDVINTAVSGTIKGVEIIEESFDGEAYTVSGQIRQEKIAPAIAEIAKKVKLSKKPAEPKRKTGKFTGLIIDATGLAELQQQKLMRIVDEKGVPVYGIEFADKNIQAQKGLCAYFDRIVFENNEHERVGNNPLTVKAQRLSNENAYIVVPNWAADEIRNNAIDFRRECRVIVVRS